MKTIKQVIADYPQHKKLIRAVLRQTDKYNFESICNYGISGGYSGFIYYSETHKFAMRNRASIINLLNEQVFDLGYKDEIDMIKNFGEFRKNGMDEDDRRDLYRYLGGAKVEQRCITNLMAWYAAEEVARMFCNE